VAAWTALADLFVRYSEENGIDPYIGRKMPRLLREAGIADVAVNPRVRMIPPGGNGRSLLLDFTENLSDHLVDRGWVTDLELSELKAALGQHLAATDTVVVAPLVVQAWGRKPLKQQPTRTFSSALIGRRQ
jgi:hypothetical protein